MMDKGFGGILIVLGMGACCIGLPLLITVIGSGSLIAWLSDNAPIGILVIFGGIIALLLIRQSKRRASIIENRTTHDQARMDDAR